jgi:hypothetical protein
MDGNCSKVNCEQRIRSNGKGTDSITSYRDDFSSRLSWSFEKKRIKLNAITLGVQNNGENDSDSNSDKDVCGSHREKEEQMTTKGYFQAKSKTEKYRTTDDDESEEDSGEHKEEEEENYLGHDKKELNLKMASLKANTRIEHDLFLSGCKKYSIDVGDKLMQYEDNEPKVVPNSFPSYERYYNERGERASGRLKKANELHIFPSTNLIYSTKIMKDVKQPQIIPGFLKGFHSGRQFEMIGNTMLSSYTELGGPTTFGEKKFRDVLSNPLATQLLQELLEHNLQPSGHNPYHLWISGDNETHCTPPHTDSNCSVLVQLRGTKTVWVGGVIAKKHCNHKIKDKCGTTWETDVRYPSYASVWRPVGEFTDDSKSVGCLYGDAFHRVTIGPGDVLYVPSRLLHAVTTGSDTIMLTIEVK